MNRRDAIKAVGAGGLSFVGTPALDVLPRRENLQSGLARPLDGGFIEVWDNMVEFGDHWGKGWTPYPIDWNDILESMKAVGMSTIIIKRLAAYDAGKLERYYVPGLNGGPAHDILRIAEQKQMRVFVGLVDEPEFDIEQVNRDYLLGTNSVFSRNRQVAAEAWPLLRQFRSFTGWYIPNELWNLNLSGGRDCCLNEFLSRTTAFLRQELARNDTAELKAVAASKQVAISPYFNREHRGRDDLCSPDQVRSGYTTILRGAGINIVMVQDSYAVMGYDAEFAAAFAVAARDSGADFWVNVENFAGGCPAPFERLALQIEQASRLQPKQIVTFDFFHFMNPVLRDCCPQPGAPQVPCVEISAIPCRDRFGSPVVEATFPSRRALYEQYRTSLRPRP
jgi:hypothetical protein